MASLSNRSSIIQQNYSAKLNEPMHEKTNNFGSYQVQHKPVFTVKEEGLQLETLDISIVADELYYLCSENKSA